MQLTLDGENPLQIMHLANALNKEICLKTTSGYGNARDYNQTKIRECAYHQSEGCSLIGSGCNLQQPLQQLVATAYLWFHQHNQPLP